MKKLISLVCTASIMASILAPVASAINLSNEAQTVRYSTEIAGKQADVEYRLENGEVTYAKITAGENVTERIGNIIYLNGVKMATIHEEPANYEDETVQPCTGWMKQDNCLYGMNCTPFVRQYGILSNKWGVLLCQREYRTNDTQRNSRSW